MRVFARVVSLLVAAAAVQDDDCLEFKFDVTFDDYPSDFKLQLGNTIDIVWEVQRNVYDDTVKHASDSICLPASDCWTVTILDSPVVQGRWTIGGTAAAEYTLMFGDKLIGNYKSERSQGPCYFSQWYTFGDECDPNVPQQGMEGGELCDQLNDGEKVVDQMVECKQLNFEIMTDAYPQDIAYLLTDSDGNSLWDARPWTSQNQNLKFQRRTCLDPQNCYTLVVYDSLERQDGLIMAPEGGEPGQFLIEFDGQRVGEYNGATDGCYLAQGYRFGSYCAEDTSMFDRYGECIGTRPLLSGEELSEDAINKAECVVFQFNMTTDEFPADTRLHLKDEDDTEVWNFQKWFQPNVNLEIDEDICLDQSKCYTFTIFDSKGFQDGLTKAPKGGVAGSYSAKWGAKTVGVYNGATDGCFYARWYRFGDGCNKNQPTEGVIGGDRCDVIDSRECVDFKFEITTDNFTNFTEDVVFSLESLTNGQIWDDVQLMQSTCLNPDECYKFTIKDINKDGLTKASKKGTTGGYALTFGNDSIDFDVGDTCYAARFGACGAVVEAEGIVGTDCESVVTVTESACVDFELKLVADGSPQDLVMSLSDSSFNKIWEKEQPLNQFNDGQVLERIMCLDPADCYTLTIEDLSGDGMTQGDEHGSFVLSWRQDTIGVFDGAMGGCYSVRWYRFGDRCPMFVKNGAVESACSDE